MTGTPPTPLIAALADKYRIERELGQGGMATVYLAEDVKHHRKVAVKVLRSDLAASLGKERFFREIEVAAKLQHPHILPLHDSGEVDGFLYYVMPFVEGVSLREKLIQAGELPVHDVVRILSEISDALAYAHAHGVVHRDMKPDNVMLTGRHALVMDFGIAKAVSEATGRQGITTIGVALGTPAYMAPEQATGEENIDQRVDIYALGAMAYELLTGRPPFTGVTAQQILSAHVTQAPEPVTQRRATCPPALAAIVMRCLEKRPADRWQSAEELTRQLDAQATPSGGITPTTTRPISTTEARPPAGRRRWIVAAAATVVLLAAGGARLLLGGTAEPAANNLAVLPIQDISGSDGAFVEAMHDQLIIAIGQTGGLTVAPRSAVMIYRSQPKPMMEVARELRVGAILEGTVFRTGQRMRINVQLTEPRTVRQIWSHSYEIDARNVLGAQDSVVRQVAAGIREAVLPSATPTVP